MAGTSMSEHRGTDVRERRLRRMQPPLHAVLLLAGTGAGIVAAVYAYARAPSWLLAVVVFGLVCDTIGRGLADALTAEHKLQQVGYVALLPLASALFLSAFYLTWGQLDLAVLLGLAGGLVVKTAFSPALADPLPMGRDDDRGLDPRGEEEASRLARSRAHVSERSASPRLVDPGRAAPGSRGQSRRLGCGRPAPGQRPRRRRRGGGCLRSCPTDVWTEPFVSCRRRRGMAEQTPDRRP